MIIYLIRHGEKEKTPGDPPLSRLGRKQAENTADFFKNKCLDCIYTSPLKRALETAEIFTSKLNLKINIDSRLLERMNWGDKKGQTFSDFMTEWQKTDIDRYYKPTRGNSSFDTGNKLKSFLDELTKNPIIKKVLVVTHGGTIGDFQRNVFPEKDLPIITDTKTNRRYIEINNCSITVVKKENNKYILQKTNFCYKI